MKSTTLVLIALLVLLTTFACKENFYYESDKVLNADQWVYQDSLNFTFAIVDTTNLYNIHLDITHSTEYPYQNIYLQIATQYPSGKRIKERLPIDFADKTGRWYGDCNSEWCKIRVNLQENAFFSSPGDHTITLEQYMRMEPLPGIRELSLKLEDIGRKK
jgi:gliding motility-associated lipoprotein GldH